MAAKTSKKSKPADDDLDLNEEETEEEEEEEEEDEEEEEEEDEEEEEEEDEDEDEDEKPSKGRGRPKGSKNKKSESVEGSLGIVVLKTGVPKKVEIVKVMGKNIKVKKPGSKDGPVFRVPVTDVRLYDEETFEKMETVAEKAVALIDKNIGYFSKLSPVTARKSVKKGNPLDEL